MIKALFVDYTGTIIKEDNHNMVNAYKPHREIFEKALEISGCRADKVIHIGDSVTSDGNGAFNTGITPILLDRRGAIKAGNTRYVLHFMRSWRTIGWYGGTKYGTHRSRSNYLCVSLSFACLSTLLGLFSLSAERAE